MNPQMEGRVVYAAPRKRRKSPHVFFICEGRESPVRVGWLKASSESCVCDTTPTSALVRCLNVPRAAPDSVKGGYDRKT